MKLLLDEMLKKTANWLRIFGVDTDFASGRDDDELLEAAKDGNMVLVTRDVPLFSRCKKHEVQCVLVKSTNLEEQIAEIKSALSLEFTFPEKTRCPACNSPLELVSGSEVPGLVDENVLKRHDKFWICRKENKVYWEGSHWRNITRIYETSERMAKEKEKEKAK
jgi:hypothetical protein